MRLLSRWMKLGLFTLRTLGNDQFSLIAISKEIPSYKCTNLSSDLLIEVPILPVPLISNWNLYTFLSHSSLWLIFCVSPCFLNVLTGQPWFVLAYLQSYYNERQSTCPVPKIIFKPSLLNTFATWWLINAPFCG